MKFPLLLILILAYGCAEKKNFTSVKAQHSSSFLEIQDRNQEILHETRIDFKNHKRSWLSVNELHPQFLKELILFEDQRFNEHFGVDPEALLGAIKDYPYRGASTLTMQTVALINQKKGKKSITGKVFQMLGALWLETSWNKSEILETYLNFVPFKGDVIGLKAASFAFFNKTPMALTREERILLLSLLPSPNQSEEKILARACRYLRKLDSKSDCGTIQKTFSASYFSSPIVQRTADNAPQLAAKFNSERGVVVTTLDKKLQLEARNILSSQIRNLSVQNVTDGAILIIEKDSGHVLAYVGSSDKFSKASLVDHVQSLRQAGSTLKPLLYYQAINKKLITMSTLLKDEPFSVTREGLTYQPENYQKSFTYLEVPAKVALGSSLNIPAVRVIDLVTPHRFYDFLADLEFRNLAEPEHYGHSMSLGAVDVTLWDLVRAYRTMALGGDYKELSFLPNQLPSTKLENFNPETSFILSSILSEKNNRYLTFGLQSSLSTDSWSAVKTGTSKDMRDNWCIGYTDKYVIGVWIGNSSGSPMWNVTGISGAAPIFNHLVTYLHKDLPSSPPKKPDTLVEKNGDYYLKGTEPLYEEILITNSRVVSKIHFPQQGSQFAYDPEIPESKQRIFFQSTTKGSWKLNGKKVGPQDLKAGFLPSKKGKYTLELWDGEIKKDEVSFFVKAGKVL